MKVVNIVGARPNFMKIAPIQEKMEKHPFFEPFLVHTGQHYDRAMSELFFDNLGLPKPDYYLGVGSSSHGVQTGKIMIEFERVLDELNPDLVLVVGDVNSTVACALDAVKRNIPVAHVEAGLRSGDRMMPEEINRILTDQISDYLFITEKGAYDNLLREGINSSSIFEVGNVMIDTLLKHRIKASLQPVLDDFGVSSRGYVLATLHRPSNVDNKDNLRSLLDALNMISLQIPVLFPVHPRTKSKIESFGLGVGDNVIFTEPLGYLDFLKCTDNAKFVLTDSGGIQEETTALGVPCITARENTERPITVEQGTNILVGCNANAIVENSTKILSGQGKEGKCPRLWDGNAASRIIDVLHAHSIREG